MTNQIFIEQIQAQFPGVVAVDVTPQESKRPVILFVRYGMATLAYTEYNSTANWVRIGKRSDVSMVCVCLSCRRDGRIIFDQEKLIRACSEHSVYVIYTRHEFDKGEVIWPLSVMMKDRGPGYLEFLGESKFLLDRSR